MAAPSFTTDDEIRFESGQNGNSDLDDSTIEEFRERAAGIIFSVLAEVYDPEELKVSNTNFEDSPAHLYLKDIEIRLASGMLMLVIYADKDDEDAITAAAFRKKSAMKDLKEIAERRKRLFGNDWEEFTTREGGGVGKIFAAKGVDDDGAILDQSIDQKY